MGANRRQSQLPVILESPQSPLMTEPMETNNSRRLSLGVNVPVNQRPERRRVNNVTGSLGDMLNDLYNASYMDFAPATTETMQWTPEPAVSPPIAFAPTTNINASRHSPLRAAPNAQWPSEAIARAEQRPTRLEMHMTPHPRTQTRPVQATSIIQVMQPATHKRSVIPQRQRQRHQITIGRSSAVHKAVPHRPTATRDARHHSGTSQAPTRRRSVSAAPLERRESSINRHLRPRVSIGGGPPVVVHEKEPVRQPPTSTKPTKTYDKPTKLSLRRASLGAERQARRASMSRPR